MPTYFLLGHGIEVTLKSVLRAHGTSLDELRNVIRHNLDKAVEGVVALDLDPLSGFVASNACLVRMLNPLLLRQGLRVPSSRVPEPAPDRGACGVPRSTA